MKSVFPIIVCIAVAAGLGNLRGSAAPVPTNDLAIPSELYMLEGTTTDLYTEAFLRRWNPYEFFVRADGDCRFERRLPRVTTVVDPAEGARLTFELVGEDDFNTICRDTVTIRVGQIRPSSETSEVTVQVLGDSFVQGAFFKSALLDSLYVPGIRMTGLRQVVGGGENFDEGRGGWTLASYFEIPKKADAPYHGFMQLDGDMRYLGATGFWINCHKVINKELTDFESRYQCGRFEKAASRFSPETGLPVKPAKGDLMWSNEKEYYLLYDGKRWRERRDIDETAWSFNYAKYLETWDIPAPEFLFETLGLNDYRDELNADYSVWDERIEIVKNSYLSAVPGGKFIIVIPCSTCGTLDNRRGDFTVRQNAAMWRFRKHLVDTFDRRTADGYHLVDMGITIDNENGYRRDSEGLQTGNPHPYPNYPTMGLPLAAFIQYHRK